MSAARDGGLFVLLAVLWGTAFVAIKAGLAVLPPVLFAAFRYDLAGVVMLGYAAVRSDYWVPRTRADWTSVLLSAALVIGLYNAFLFVGQQGVTSGVAAILIATNPILATGFSRGLLPDERLGLVGLGGLGLGFAGVAVVARPTLSGGLTNDLVAPGLIIAAAVCIALGSVLVQRIDDGIGTEGLVAWSTVLGALVLHAISLGLPSESLANVRVTTEAVLAVAYLAILASAVGYVVYFDLLDRLGAIEINLVSYATPVFAAAAGWIVLGETLTPATLVGFALITAGFAVVKRDALREEVVARRYRDRS
jgi:drug/metabolite transporter (DMT)-like permease